MKTWNRFQQFNNDISLISWLWTRLRSLFSSSKALRQFMVLLSWRNLLFRSRSIFIWIPGLLLEISFVLRVFSGWAYLWRVLDLTVVCGFLILDVLGNFNQKLTFGSFWGVEGWSSGILGASVLLVFREGEGPNFFFSGFEWACWVLWFNISGSWSSKPRPFIVWCCSSAPGEAFGRSFNETLVIFFGGLVGSFSIPSSIGSSNWRNKYSRKKRREESKSKKTTKNKQKGFPSLWVRKRHLEIISFEIEEIPFQVGPQKIFLGANRPQQVLFGLWKFLVRRSSPCNLQIPQKLMGNWFGKQR